VPLTAPLSSPTQSSIYQPSQVLSFQTSLAQTSLNGQKSPKQTNEITNEITNEFNQLTQVGISAYTNQGIIRQPGQN
jgi:hypothetical protein